MNRGFKSFLLIWIATFISAIGSGVSSFGLAVYLFKETGLSTSTGLVLLAGFLPGLIVSPFSGAIADRFDRRLLMLMGDSLSAIGIVMILISMLLGNDSMWIILTGVSISSVFSSLVEPAFKATVTDLLDKDLFSKASGLMQLTHSAKFLISPFLAGIFMGFSDILFLLWFDVITIIPLIFIINSVRKEIPFKAKRKNTSIIQDIKSVFSLLRNKKGIWKLVVLGSQISVFLGILQTMITPFIMSFEKEKFLGFATSFSAVGILVSSIILGMITIKKHHHRILCSSLFMAGIFMAGFGIRENKFSICLFGFLFFAMLPFANMGMDYLIRTNLDTDVQGRAWGIIGLISQLGYVLSYVMIGPVADYLVVPIVNHNTSVKNIVGIILGRGRGSGFAAVILLSGIALCFVSIALYREKSIKKLEEQL